MLHMANEELSVLQALRLKGRGTAEVVAAASGVDEGTAKGILDGLVSSEGAREVNGNYMLLPPARERLTQLLDEERATVDQGALKEQYDAFVAINSDFKQLATDWQMR